VVIWQFAVFILMWGISPLLASAFTSEPEVAHLIQLFLMIVPLGYGLQGVVILTNSSFNAMHKPMLALSLSIIRLFVLFVPISYLGSRLYNLEGMFWAGILANLLTATVAYKWFKDTLNKMTEMHNCALEQESA
jgi:Na+-driven multidrug efflux pump